MTYASVSDLEDWLTPEPAPAHAARLLEEATDALTLALTGATYDPANPAVQDVLRKACVRQVHWMMDRDDETGATNDLQSMSAGSRSFTRRTVGTGAGAAPTIAPQAAVVLRASGLLTMWPLVVG
ncbi:hypothetical protein GPZ77_34615 (plasmid) [Streptomyces sp. QHH-9511]|uniref:hypothetical protein n=1 Tax=Streptomyces sp. QHH-9511 TaxID=2684468 RepID=UPI0013182A41|nr:hypothetical protein [Streptomyces sp. QHH-9511]QGZ53365.1 hypothetical protein GPZ77_34615 [Streptomyces sp. QHH-9511]